MKGVPLNEQLYQYLCEFGGAEDDFLRQLNEEAAELGIPQIQISPEQLAVIQFLLNTIRARRVVEIGSLAGYSTIGMLRVLPPDGVLYAFEKEPRYAQFVQAKAAAAGVAEKLRLIVGDAHQQLRRHTFEAEIDFVFLDADKTGYRDYAEFLTPHIRRGGILAADNALMGGEIINVQTTDPDVQAMQEFNQWIKSDRRYQSCIVPVGDGMLLALKQ